MIRVILVDDRQTHLVTLRKHLEEYKEIIEIAGEFTDAEKACKGIISQKPDVIFLDIEMPGFSGIEIAKKVKSVCSNVVFLTEFMKFAPDAIAIRPIHFIDKARIEEFLSDAIAMIEERMSQATANGMILVKNDASRIKDGIKDKKRYVVKFEDIICIEIAENSNGNDLRIHTLNKVFEEHNQINYYQKKLNTQSKEIQNLFWHINKHALINCKFVDSFSSEERADRKDKDKPKKKHYFLYPVESIKNKIAKNEMREWEVALNRVSKFNSEHSLPYIFTDK